VRFAKNAVSLTRTQSAGTPLSFLRHPCGTATPDDTPRRYILSMHMRHARLIAGRLQEKNVPEQAGCSQNLAGAKNWPAKAKVVLCGLECGFR
jgi:hypothetical protein